MALLTNQPLTELGLEATYAAADINGDEAIASDDLILHVKLAAAASESQLISFTGVPTGGTFKLEFDDGETTNTTADITYAAGLTAATVEAALEALPNIEPADVAVSGSNGGPFTVTFAGQYANQDIAMLIVVDEALTGGTDPGIVITQSSGGIGGVVVSVEAQVACNFNFFHHRSVSIPTGEERFIGPFPRHYWNEAGRIKIDYSSPNGVTIAALVP